MRTLRNSCVAIVMVSLSISCFAQFGGLAQKAQEAQQRAKEAKQAKAIYTAWSPEKEQQVGEASAAKLISIFGLYENPDMVKYVNLVGNVVAQRAERKIPYRFGILNTEVITALSLPGGYVFITRGALANMKSEAELAGTLAHEVAHVDQRHLEKEIRSKDSMAFIKQETAQFSQTDLDKVASTFVSGALSQKYSRDKESDADRLGLQFASNAGYEADGLRMFLTFLSQAPKTPDSSRQLGLWGSTHPPLAERIASLTALEANYPKEGQVLAERFLRHVNAEAFAPH